MITERTKKPGNKRLLTIVVASILLVLIALYVTLELLINAGIISLGTTQPSDERIPLKDGEAYYGTSTVAYPSLDSSSIQYIDIDAEGGSFSLLRPKAGEEFLIYYEDEDGNTVPYAPPIVDAEGSFDYSQFFAYDTSSGLSIPKISYLCAALGSLLFTTRVELEEENRNAQLVRYGLDEGNYDTITVTYIDSDGKEKAHVIRIGNSLLTGSGYYYMVDGRDYVYTSTGKGLDYALGGLESFLHSRVVATGLSSDGAYEPYLTTNYQQWKHTVHKTVGEVITPDSEVIVSATRFNPVYDGESESGQDGYYRQNYSKMSMDLSILDRREGYDNVVDALLSASVGSYAENPLLLTVITDKLEVELDKAYSYEIVAIESVITENGEIDETGYAVGTADFVRISYNLKIDGTRVNEKLYHGLIDLTSGGTAPDAVKTALRGQNVGTLTEPISYDKVYTEENTEPSLYEYVITDIVVIYDSNYKVATKIAADSKVSYRYIIRVDGKQVGEEEQRLVDLAAITAGDDLKIKEELIGRGVANDVGLVAFDSNRYGQDVYGFTTYAVDEIQYFVDKEIITSFKFVNAVDRNPFFGESLYKNTLENENKSYALNSEVCERVVKALGGVASSTSDGLLGSKTVAIGLTPSNMETYGLYANTIYFELPRGINAYTDPTGSGYTSIDSFNYLSTLGFYLYISDEQDDGTRYVGSDMYDIVVQMDASVFDFVEHSFVEFWARRSLVMVDYKHIDYVNLEFSMSDLYGNYNFDFDHKTIYLDSSGNHYDEQPESGGTEYDFVTIDVTPSGNCTDNLLLRMLAAMSSSTKIDLENMYTNPNTGKLNILGDDYAGTAYFKELLLMLFSTYYTGTLTEEEQAEAFLSGEKLMSLTFALDTTLAGSAASPFPYVYDFYRASDRRIMVVIRQVTLDGETMSQVSDFYISQFAFKKIVNSFEKLLNGQVVDQNEVY